MPDNKYLPDAYKEALREEEKRNTIREYLKSIGNPYSPDTAQATAWTEGYCAALQEARRMINDKLFGREKE